jgi:hypothetical protein
MYSYSAIEDFGIEDFKIGDLRDFRCEIAGVNGFSIFNLEPAIGCNSYSCPSCL